MDCKEIINELDAYVEEIGKAYKDYVTKVDAYKSKQSSCWLDTDFKEVLGTGRPTVDEKKAYVNKQCEVERKARDDAYYEIEYLKHRIELCNLKLKVCNE